MKPSDITDPCADLVEAITERVYAPDTYIVPAFLVSRINTTLNIMIHKYLQTMCTSPQYDYSQWYDAKHELQGADRDPLINGVINAIKIRELDNIL